MTSYDALRAELIDLRRAIQDAHDAPGVPLYEVLERWATTMTAFVDVCQDMDRRLSQCEDARDKLIFYSQWLRDTGDTSMTLPYDVACHAMQTGVAYELEKDPTSATPKHLRVGINSAMVNDAALAGLLIKKGIITEAEYADAVTSEMNREVERYQEKLFRLYHAVVTLR
jgi:hypothetical protein